MAVTKSDGSSPTEGVSSNNEPPAVMTGARPRVKLSTTNPPGDLLREVSRTEGGDRSTALEIYQMTSAEEAEAGREAPGTEESLSKQDAKLQKILKNYLALEKDREFDPKLVLSFVKEQLTQLKLPKKQQDWSTARRLYLELFGIDDAKMKEIEGGRFAGGWIGSGTLYALATQMMTFMMTEPAIYNANVPLPTLREQPVHYSRVSLGSLGAVAATTSFINSAFQIVLVARQELMRSKGQSARSAEMKAAPYPKIKAKMKDVIAKMDASTAKMEAHSQALAALKEGSEDWLARKEQMEADGETSLDLMGQFAELNTEFDVRHDVTDLNYAGQIRQSWARALRTAANLAAQVGSIATKNSHVGNYIQIGGTLLSMGVSQFWAGPADQYAKQDKTLMATIASTRLVKPESRHKEIEELDVSDLDFSDLGEQWKGPISVALGQFTECVELQLAYVEQDMADIVGLDVDSFRELEELQEKLDKGKTLKKEEVAEHQRLTKERKKIGPSDEKHEKFTELREKQKEFKQQIEYLDTGEWLKLPAEEKKGLLKAVSGEHPWLLALKVAWTRLRVPADLISQFAQRAGSSQMAMIFANTTAQLLTSSIIRYVNAKKEEAGEDPAVSDTARYAISVVLALVGWVGNFSSGAAVNWKILNRKDLREMIPRVGFQPRATGLALKSIGQAMFQLPAAIWDRATIEYTTYRGKSAAEKLRKEVAKMGLKLEELGKRIEAGKATEEEFLEALEDIPKVEGESSTARPEAEILIPPDETELPFHPVVSEPAVDPVVREEDFDPDDRHGKRPMKQT